MGCPLEHVKPLQRRIEENCLRLRAGDILVQIGPDDILFDHCFAELANAFGTSDAGFVYSNFAIPAAATAGLGERVGWLHRPFDYQGRQLAEVIAFEPAAASLAFAWYWPGPVCAWRKSAYDATAGHNPARDLVDDHEVLIQTFLKIRMKHLNRPLCFSPGYGKTRRPQQS